MARGMSFGSKLITSERSIFGLCSIVVIAGRVGQFWRNPVVEKIDSALSLVCFFVCLVYCVVKIRETSRTGIVSVRFGFWTQKTDRTDPTLFILMVGMYWCAAIVFAFFISMGLLGFVRF